MRRAHEQLATHAQIKDSFCYSPETGVITWNKTIGKMRKGLQAGTIDSLGYRRIKLDGRLYRAHQLAWMYVHGSYPAGEVDHINCIKDDNRISNLRVVSRAANNQNLRGPKRNNKSGFLGVTLLGSKWKACIRVNRQRINLGVFLTPELAHAAYLAAKKQLHVGYIEL